ncbi:PEPxxWA-CTERM sorting domain-containing protein [Qipengyuania sp.]|uniref:PEPxxWA-CTERM sorting domain-containing protein n=1 Tax=Qipengyuania sp. TaxID=2004515 RepID=UPI0035C7D676
MKMKMALLVATAFAVAAPAHAAQTLKWAHWYDKSVLGTTNKSGDQLCTANCTVAPVFNASGPVVLGFEANNQYQNAALGRNFVPPDTMGAVGTTQYMVTLNGSIGIYDKYTGAALTPVFNDNAFWQAAGLNGTSGDPRVMFNAQMNRWVTIAFGSNVKDLQIAVSDTDDALGPWKAVRFEGYGGLPGIGGGIADYPTLAMDTNAIYIGTNNFAPTTPGAGATFKGTTLNVIPIDSIFAAGGPTVANMTQFETPYPGTFEDRGYAIQGVNSTSASSTGNVFSSSLYNFDTLTYTIDGLSSSSATGASRGDVVYMGEAGYTGAGAGRQPAVNNPAAQRVIDTLDDRVSSSVYESNGYIFAVHTVNPTGDAAGDYARVRILVMDAATQTLVDQYDIGTGDYDYYQGSLAVNADGTIVVGFNRSGLNPTDGKIQFKAMVFTADDNGQLRLHSGELLLKESLTDEYHLGSPVGGAPSGRQRWGDYSQVSLDPTDPNRFYLIGQWAREPNNAANGHPGGTGFHRWSTWVSVVDAGFVPEPSTWVMLILGFGMIGGAMRRQRAQTVRIAYA